MLIKTLLALILSLSYIMVEAATFQVMSLEKMIEESTAAAEVELKSKKSFMNKMGLIFTEYFFIVHESHNLNTDELDGEYLKITLTGGTVNGVTSYVDGAPDFSIGEKSFLLLKNIESKMYISNFTMGKFRIEERNGQVQYTSVVFPNHPDLGKIKKERMLELLKLKYKTTYTRDDFNQKIQPHSDLYDKKALKHQSKKRVPAQEIIENRSIKEGHFALWGFFFLLVITSFGIWWKLISIEKE